MRPRFAAVKSGYRLAKFIFKVGVVFEGVRRVLSDERRRRRLLDVGRKVEGLVARTRS